VPLTSSTGKVYLGDRAKVEEAIRLHLDL